LDQGPRPALLVVSSNLMALCVAGSYSWARTACCSSVFSGPLRSEWHFARTFQDYRSSAVMSTNFVRFLSVLFARWPRQPYRLAPSWRNHSASMSKNPYADDGAGHLAPDKSFPCSNLGLESSWPNGLASRIKRLDCASSYSSTSRSHRFRPARPILSRCEALSYLSYST
jgi:hypothetical protein